jgi:type IV fimbrial biogenesis protein FimT
MKTFNFKSVKGITLIELMITIAIAGILISLAAPNFRASVQNNRMVTEVNDLHASLNLGRSEAIKRNSDVTICASNNGKICTGDWKDGWIVFADNDVNGVIKQENIIRVHGPISASSTLLFSDDQVTYASDGTSTGGSKGTFTLCDSRGAAHARGLVIGLSGRPRHAVDSDANGTLNDAKDLDLACS